MKDYDEYVYILLTDTGTFLTKTIQKYTEAPYNHVSIGFDKECNELYSFGRKHPKNPIYGGFVKENVYVGTYAYYPNTTCALYELPVTKREKEKIKRVIRAFEQKQDVYTYNLLGLVGVVMDQPINIPASYFCSQFVAEVLKRAGKPMSKKNVCFGDA